MAIESKPAKMTPTDHKRVVEEDLSIMKSVNDTVDDEDGPFAFVGDLNVGKLKSFWYKV